MAGGVPLTVVPLALFASESQEAPVRLKLYGGSPPDALNGIDTAVPAGIEEAGQVPVRFSGGAAWVAMIIEHTSLVAARMPLETWIRNV